VTSSASEAAGGRVRAPALRPLSLWPFGLFAVLAALGLTLDAFTVSIGNQVLLVATAALGYNLMFGNAGQVSIGSAAFIAMGAFVAVGATFGLHLPFVLTVAAGGLAAAVLGVAIGIPSLRLGSHYLVFSTLALHFLTLFALSKTQTNPAGWSLPVAAIGPLELVDQHRWALVYAALFVFVLWLVRNLLARRPGRAWTAVREHPAAAAMMGVDVVFWRLAAFAFSAFVFGAAGALQAHYLRHVSIDDFSLEQAITYVVVILVGGLGSVAGSVAGAVTVVAVPYLINAAISLGLLGDEGDILARHQFVLVGLVYGALLVTVLLVEPGGIAAAVGRFARWVRRGPRLRVPRPARPRRRRARTVEGGPVLQVRELRVAYGRAEAAVDGISFEVAEGTIFTLLGPNGAGKTTTLRAIAGFLPGDRAAVSAAEIRVAGRDVTGLGPAAVARQGLSFVPERDKVFRGLSIAGNLALRLPSRPSERRRVLDEIHEIFPRLAGLDRRREAGLLSGGERQMLALALALAGRPRLLVIDEASLGLAPVAIRQLSAALRRLRDERGTTILLAEQNAQMALDISDELCLILNGRLGRRAPRSEWTEQGLRDAYLGVAGEPEPAAT
jgi:branched-chain amino acid transport system permease protein